MSYPSDPELTRSDVGVAAGADDPQLTAGVPACVQIVGRRWRDEELLGLGEIVANLCGSKDWKQ